RGAGDQSRELAGEIDLVFGQQRTVGKPVGCVLGVLRIVEHAHALAVVAAARSLQNNRPAGLLAEGDQRLDVLDLGPQRVGKSQALDGFTHDQLVLGMDQGCRARLDVDALVDQGRQEIVGNVLVVKGDYVLALGEFAQGFEVLVVAYRGVRNAARS